MRASQWVLGLATASAIVAAIASGCGGSSTGSTSTDSGTDATNDVAHEAAPVDAAPPDTGPSDAASEACAVDADLSTIPVPDASLGDAGQTAAGCVTCVQAACPNLVSQCNASCACKTAFVAFEACVASGTSLQTCAVALASSAGLPITDFACAVGCATPCGVALPAGDGGGNEGGQDGASDATGQ
jgi:hypothetical protein